MAFWNTAADMNLVVQISTRVLDFLVRVQGLSVDLGFRVKLISWSRRSQNASCFRGDNLSSVLSNAEFLPQNGPVSTRRTRKCGSSSFYCTYVGMFAPSGSIGASNQSLFFLYGPEKANWNFRTERRWGWGWARVRDHEPFGLSLGIHMVILVLYISRLILSDWSDSLRSKVCSNPIKCLTCRTWTPPPLNPQVWRWLTGHIWGSLKKHSTTGTRPGFRTRAEAWTWWSGAGPSF